MTYSFLFLSSDICFNEASECPDFFAANSMPLSLENLWLSRQQNKIYNFTGANSNLVAKPGFSLPYPKPAATVSKNCFGKRFPTVILFPLSVTTCQKMGRNTHFEELLCFQRSPEGVGGREKRGRRGPCANALCLPIPFRNSFCPPTPFSELPIFFWGGGHEGFGA